MQKIIQVLPIGPSNSQFKATFLHFSHDKSNNMRSTNSHTLAAKLMQSLVSRESVYKKQLPIK